MYFKIRQFSFVLSITVDHLDLCKKNHYFTMPTPSGDKSSKFSFFLRSVHMVATSNIWFIKLMFSVFQFYCLPTKNVNKFMYLLFFDPFLKSYYVALILYPAVEHVSAVAQLRGGGRKGSRGFIKNNIQKKSGKF